MNPEPLKAPEPFVSAEKAAIFLSITRRQKKGTVYFLRGRLKFGSASNSAPFPSAIVIFGKFFNP